MSFVEQEDVFKIVEKLFVKLFKKFSTKKILSEKFQEFLLKNQLKNMEQINQI